MVAPPDGAVTADNGDQKDGDTERCLQIYALVEKKVKEIMMVVHHPTNAPVATLVKVHIKRTNDVSSSR